MTRRFHSILTAASVAAMTLAVAPPAAAQLDPLLFVKGPTPNVVLAIDTSARMRLDADGTYYDPVEYTVQSTAWEPVIGVPSGATTYRRKYSNWVNTSVVVGTPTFQTSRLAAVGNNDSKYAHFAALTRLALVRAAVTQVINENTGVARFGLIKTRQLGQAIPNPTKNATGTSTDLAQSSPTENVAGTWSATLATVTSDNGLQGAQPPVVLTDAASSNASITTLLSRSATDSGALVPAGGDTATKVDSPVNYMLVDAKTESSRLIAADVAIANDFGVLLRSLVDTIDKWGLKTRHLRRHKRDVDKFFSKLESSKASSEAAL